MISKVGSADGTIYLHTHKGDSAEEIAEALAPYIGRFASFYPPNNYGHINPHESTRAWIRAIDGVTVTVEVPRTGYIGDVNAFDAFGSYCTRIHPASKRESV